MSSSGIKARAAPKRSPFGIGLGERPGELRLNHKFLHSTRHLYCAHSTAVAAKTILRGCLLSTGIQIRRNGEIVQLTEGFKRHINDAWMRFAHDALDALLCWSLVPVIFEETEEAENSKKRARTGDGSAVVFPIVPPLETFDIACSYSASGFHRRYTVVSNGITSSRQETNGRVFVVTPPDDAGNVCSPIGAAHDLLAFVDELRGLAREAELTLARPRLWTQQQKRTNGEFDPSSLLFDTESRELAAGEHQENAARDADALAAQSRLCALLNKIQTTSPSAGGAGYADTLHSQPDVKPQLFTVPRGQELVSLSGHLPQARGDLEALQRLSIDSLCAALGVPSDLVYSSGRSGIKSASQLVLLNSTVDGLRQQINRILTSCYAEIYNDAEASVELSVTPLSSSEEIAALHTAGLVPRPVAIAKAMASIGCSEQEIEQAVQEAKNEEEELKKARKAELPNQEIAQNGQEVELKDVAKLPEKPESSDGSSETR